MDEVGAVISAITRRVPLHKGHMVTSKANARLSRSAQVSFEDVVFRGGRIGADGLSGTMRRLSLLLGANTP